MDGWQLVTGGAGFIGSHLVAELLARGLRVRVLDNLSTGEPSNLASWQAKPSFQFLQGDVTSPQQVAHAMSEVDTVYHLAALASVQRSVEAPAESHEICATGTLHVLDAARRAGVRRIVYAGSASAYGMPSEPVQREDAPIMPLSPYAAAKLSGEAYCQAFTNSFGLETVRLRFFNIFGPRQRADSPYSGVIAIFVDRLRRGLTPILFGDGLQTRDFTYVGDVVTALIGAAQTPKASGHVYNIGTGHPTRLLELLATLKRLLGTDIEAKHEQPRAGDIRHSCADISAARTDLGYRPTITLEEGLRRTLKWEMEESRPGD
jgi:UDP-glucose 4-epimerase